MMPWFSLQLLSKHFPAAPIHYGHFALVSDVMTLYQTDDGIKGGAHNVFFFFEGNCILSRAKKKKNVHVNPFNGTVWQY